MGSQDGDVDGFVEARRAAVFACVDQVVYLLHAVSGCCNCMSKAVG